MCTLVMLASAVIFYAKVAKKLPRGGLFFLIAMRVLAIAVIVLCFVRPVISFEKQVVTKSDVLFLVDTSRSMSVSDAPALPSRLERVKAAAQTVDRHVRSSFEPTWFRFDAEVKQLDDLAELAQVEPTGDATDVAKAVAGAVKGHDRSTLAGVVVFTDGLDNAAGNVVQEIARLGVPVFPVGVGTKLRDQQNFVDANIVEVEAGVGGFVSMGSTATIQCQVEAIGLADRIVELQMADKDGAIAASAEVILDDVDGTQPVALEFKPEDLGAYKFKVFIDALPGEKILENNVQEVTINVVPRKIKVLLTEGSLRSEYKFLLRTLQRDPDVELVSLVRIREGLFVQQGNVQDVKFAGFPDKAEDLAPFNVFIFGDIEAGYFTGEQMQLVVDRVKAGAGFLMLGGYSSFGPGGYEGTLIEDILPVRVGGKEIGQAKEPFLLTLSPEGVGHPIFYGLTNFFVTAGQEAMGELPELLGCVKIAGVKPGATVLAVNPKETIGAESMPVVAVQELGKGRSAAFLADTTWKWYLEMKGVGEESPYVRFWGQLVRWLAGFELKKGGQEPGVDFFVDKTFLQPGESVRIHARARGEEGLATKKAQVEGLVMMPDGVSRSIQLLYQAPSEGEYETVFEPPLPGSYEVDLQGRLGRELLGKTTLAFQVGKPNLEFERLDIDADLLKAIASSTKGNYFYLTNVSNLEQYLGRSRRQKAEIEEISAWDSAPMMGVLFALFVVFLSIEWIARRLFQLA